MKIAIIWSRFGSYHLARLRGAGEVSVKKDSSIVGIEISQTDHYQWDVSEGAKDFDRIILFPDAAYNDLAADDIRCAVKKTLDNICPDAVAINGWSVPEARAAIAWCRKRPNVKAVLMSETKVDDTGKRFWWKEKYKGWLINQCDAALVGGRPHKEYLQRLGFQGDRIFLGYDVVDNDYFARETRRIRQNGEDYRIQFKLPENYFFACTRFLQRKNIDGLLKAYKKYQAESSVPWGLVIAGEGEEAETLHRLQKELGVYGVHWPGFLQYSDLPVYYGLANAFVHPALSEAWGLVVNEGAASGLPLLVSNTVGARYELVEDGKNGILFDPNNINAMKNAMLFMSDLSDGEREAMGRRSTKIVSKWSPRRFGDGLFAAIDKCVKRKTLYKILFMNFLISYLSLITVK